MKRGPRFSIHTKIMDFLDEREEFIGSGMKLARILKADRNSVGYALRRLEEKGYIKRIMVNGHIKSIKYIPPFEV